MISSPINKALTLLSLLSLSAAAPTTRQAPNYPPTLLSSNFRLIANVTGADLSPPINHFELSSYHTGAGTALAVLSPASGRTFYVNGTAEEVRYRRANLLTDGGSPPFPFGVSISPATGALAINAGAGQPGLGLTQFPVPVPSLAGAYYVCAATDLPFGAAVQVFAGEEAPAGCAAVRFLPQCAEGSGAADEFANTVNCFADVAAIDWSVYSAA